MERIAPIPSSLALVPVSGVGAARRERVAAPAAAAAQIHQLSTPAVWTLARETAAAALSAQMMGRTEALRRGLKADAGERARYARAYAGAARPRPDAGMVLRRSA